MLLDFQRKGRQPHHFLPGSSRYCSTLFVLWVDYGRAAVQYVLCSNHYDGSDTGLLLPEPLICDDG